MKKALALLWIGACLAAAPAHAGDTHRLRFSEVIALALSRNVDVAAGQAGVAQATAARKRARGHYGPVLKFEGNVMVWDSTLKLDLGSGDTAALGALPAPQTPYEFAFAEMLKSFANMPDLRDQVTGQLTLSLSQPLTPLWQIHLGHQAQKLGEQVAESQLQRTRRKVALEAALGYLQVLHATAIVANVESSIAQLQAQVRRLEALQKREVVLKADLQRLQVALATAEQGAIRARAGVELARTALAVGLGLPTGDTVEPVSTAPAAPPAVELSLDQAYAQALASRPELQELRLRIEQADIGRRVAVANMVPAVAAVATYQHSEGSGLSDPDSVFGGLFLSWNVWEWGASYYGIREAEAQQRQVELARESAARYVFLEVKKAFIDVQTAIAAQSVANAALAQAEEAFRVESKRYEEGASTATDLLDAEAALTRARNSQTTASYEVLIAYATYRTAIGAQLDGAWMAAGETNATH